MTYPPAHGHGIGLPQPPPPPPPWYRKMPVWGWVLAGVGGLFFLCCVGLLIVGLLNPQPRPQADPTSSRPAPTTTTATAPTQMPAATTPAPALTSVPDLPPEAAAKLEVVTVEARDFHGREAYWLTLSRGHAWAIRGTPAQVVPLAMDDPSYNENGAVFLRSGPWVIYILDYGDMPDGMYVGPFPGMTVIDTDLPL